MRALPKPPTGDSPIVQHIRELHKCIRERTPLKNEVLDIDFKDNGWLIKGEISRPTATSNPIIKAVNILGVGAETLTCRDPIDDTIYQVAKPWRLRVSSFTQLEQGITAAATGVQTRVLSGSINGVTVLESQEITPRYFEPLGGSTGSVSGELLLIMKVPAEALNLTGDDGQPVVWTDLNGSARAWAAKSVILG